MEANDPLIRFFEIQQNYYRFALEEIEGGKKTGDWTKYLFPQLNGVDADEISRKYAIHDIDEASRYLLDETLGTHLINCCKALLKHPQKDVFDILGTEDCLVLRSSITLFDAVPTKFPIFENVLNKFFHGVRDHNTLNLLKTEKRQL